MSLGHGASQITGESWLSNGEADRKLEARILAHAGEEIDCKKHARKEQHLCTLKSMEGNSHCTELLVNSSSFTDPLL
jgi:hypothetical protein